MTDEPIKRKRAGGRPKSDNPRQHSVNVRLTADEKSRLEELAGKGSLSELLRSSALGRAARLSRSVPAVNREAWTELSRAASNLNQLAYRSNSGDTVDPDEMSIALTECRKLLADVRHVLLTGRSITEEDDEVIDDSR